MTAYERRGLRLGLLVIVLASVTLAIIGWSLWPLGGLIVPAVALWVIRPGTGKARSQKAPSQSPER